MCVHCSRVCSICVCSFALLFLSSRVPVATFVERRRASVVAGDGGQYALRDFICYVGSVEIVFVSVFFREGWQTNKKNCLFWGPFCDR